MKQIRYNVLTQQVKISDCQEADQLIIHTSAAENLTRDLVKRTQLVVRGGHELWIARFQVQCINP